MLSLCLLQVIAVTIYLGGLTLSSPIRHSDTSKVKRCPNLHRLPNELIVGILDHLGPQALASLAETNGEGYGWCKPGLSEMKAKARLFIGNTPTFMPAIKRCLIHDDLSCYKFVLEYFVERRLVEYHHLAQMPALAAQLGASKIFLSLGKNASDPHWYHWMTRAVVRERFHFLEEVAGISPPPSHVPVRPHQKPLGFYDTLTYVRMISGPFNRPLFQKLLINDWKREYERLYKDWIVKDMVKEQPPLWENIFDALSIEDDVQREATLREFNTNIRNFLSKGVYIIDDVTLNPTNTHIFWQNFVATSEETLNDRSNFVMWLIGEGSPISDVVLMEALSIPETAENWSIEYMKREIPMAVKYASGSVNASLVNQLRVSNRYFGAGAIRISRVLPIYKDVLHANFSDPMVLKYAKKLVKATREGLHDSFHVFFDSIETFFKDQGHDLHEL